MKKISVSESAFFNPRALIGFGFGAIGLLLAVLGLVAFPSSSARATSTCSDVQFTEYLEGYSDMYVEMSSDPGCTIFATVNSYSYPSDPTHNGGTQTGITWIYIHEYNVPVHQKRYFKALAYISGAPDSGITSYEADNTQL